MPVDFLATERHFVDHLAPIWRALKVRGTFYAPPGMHPIAASRGIESRWPHSGTDPVLVASYGDLKKARGQGRPLALIEHGYGQTFSSNHPSYAGGKDRDDVGLFLVPNEHAAQRNREANPHACVEMVGCPKLDDLPQRQGSGLTIALSFHWDASSVAPEATGTAPYYKRALPSLAEEYHILGHGHPRAMSRLQRYYRRAKIEVVHDFADICRRADLYVCDYSSTIYEFAATGRPVVVLNGPQYRRDVHHGLRFWEAANVGVQVDHLTQLRAAIERALTDPPEQQALREQALNLVYSHRTGGAQRAARTLEEWIGAL